MMDDHAVVTFIFTSAFLLSIVFLTVKEIQVEEKKSGWMRWKPWVLMATATFLKLLIMVFVFWWVHSHESKNHTT